MAIPDEFHNKGIKNKSIKAKFLEFRHFLTLSEPLRFETQHLLKAIQTFYIEGQN